MYANRFFSRVLYKNLWPWYEKEVVAKNHSPARCTHRHHHARRVMGNQVSPEFDSFWCGTRKMVWGGHFTIEAIFMKLFRLALRRIVGLPVLIIMHRPHAFIFFFFLNKIKQILTLLYLKILRACLGGSLALKAK